MTWVWLAHNIYRLDWLRILFGTWSSFTPRSASSVESKIDKVCEQTRVTSVPFVKQIEFHCTSREIFVKWRQGHGSGSVCYRRVCVCALDNHSNQRNHQVKTRRSSDSRPSLPLLRSRSSTSTFSVRFRLLDSKSVRDPTTEAATVGGRSRFHRNPERHPHSSRVSMISDSATAAHSSSSILPSTDNPAPDVSFRATLRIPMRSDSRSPNVSLRRKMAFNNNSRNNSRRFDQLNLLEMFNSNLTDNNNSNNSRNLSSFYLHSPVWESSNRSGNSLLSLRRHLRRVSVHRQRSLEVSNHQDRNRNSLHPAALSDHRRRMQMRNSSRHRRPLSRPPIREFRPSRRLQTAGK